MKTPYCSVILVSAEPSSMTANNLAAFIPCLIRSFSTHALDSMKSRHHLSCLYIWPTFIPFFWSSQSDSKLSNAISSFSHNKLYWQVLTKSVAALPSVLPFGPQHIFARVPVYLHVDILIFVWYISCVACWGLWAKYCDNVYCKYTRQSGANGIQSLDSPKSTSTGQSFKSTLHPKGTKLAESTNCVYDSLTKCPVCPQTRTTKSLSQLRIKK